jgi:hypothetical protein
MTTHREDMKPAAAILHFPRRRGRPKATRMQNDTGTPELVMKRLMGETAEALDLCLECGIITREQHWCGIHLRWLYTLRYGAPGVRAVDQTNPGGIEAPRPDDPAWRAAREKEYHDAMMQLSRRGLAQAVTSLCIFNERPGFLSLHIPVTEKGAKRIARYIQDLQAGLDLLISLWKASS